MNALTILGILALLFIIIVLFVIWNMVSDQNDYDNNYGVKTDFYGEDFND